MNSTDVQGWLDRYIASWRSNERAQIEDLFTEDAVYRYVPYDRADSVAHGRAEIATGWLEDADAPGSWEARYEPFAIDGDRAVATGYSRYAATETEPERTYHNAFLMRFAPDGRCTEFTEYYMLEKQQE